MRDTVERSDDSDYLGIFDHEANLQDDNAGSWNRIDATSCDFNWSG